MVDDPGRPFNEESVTFIEYPDVEFSAPVEEVDLMLYPK